MIKPIKRQEMKLKQIVLYEFTENGHRKKVAAFISHIDEQSFKLLRLDIFEETESIPFSRVFEAQADKEKIVNLTVCDEKTMLEYLAIDRTNLVNNVTEAKQALSEAEDELEVYDINRQRALNSLMSTD